jgi:hypothetical protein
MDECIGSLMPLYTFVTAVKDTAILDSLMQTLFHSECEHRTWLIRPALLITIGHLQKAFVKKQIHGAFILSNNGSEELVGFVAKFLNYCMWKLYDKTGTQSEVFQMACSANSPVRKPYGLVKNFEVVQLCLAAQGLPPCTKESDLLFFDDLDHPMRAQIPNYVRVPAYLFQTEINQFLAAMQPMEQHFSKKDWQTIVQRTRYLNTLDFNRPNNTYKSVPQSIDGIIRDVRMFQNAFTKFLKPKQTRKRK